VPCLRRRSAPWTLIIGLGCATLTACGPDRGRLDARPADGVQASLAIPGRTNGTPSITARGDLVAVAWSAALPDQGPDIFAALSRDGGRTFDAPIKVNDAAASARATGEQPPRIALSVTGAAVVWVARREGRTEVRFARSNADMTAFGASAIVHEQDLPGARGWASVAAEDNGRLHVAWLDGRSADPRPAAEHVHGATPVAPTSSTASAPVSPSAAPPRQDVMLAAIDRDGRTQEILVAANVCFCCKTSVAMTASATAAVAWRGIYPGSFRDIAVAQVPAGAESADEVRVSEDGWQINACPDDGPSLTVDEGGALHVLWPTMIPGAKPQKAIFYAAAQDGRTFAPRARVDTGTGSPAHPSLTLSGDGGLVAAWDEIGESRTRVRMRRLPYGATSWTPVTTLTDHGTYPTLTRTPSGALAAWVDKPGPTATIKISEIK